MLARRDAAALALTLVCAMIAPSALRAQPAPGHVPGGNAKTGTDTDTGAGTGTQVPEPTAAAPLPAEHVPQVALELTPKTGVATGDVVHLTLRADALVGDDVTVPEQTFAPFEVRSKRARVEPAQNGKQRFVFDLDLVAFDPGELALPAVELRVVTKDGFVGSVKTDPQPIKITALLGNEPDAKLKPGTQPVVVMQDDYRLLYALGAVLAAALIALLTWLTSRYLQRRKKPVPPPPPPRPPWEIAVEKLGELRKRKQRMVEEGRAAQFVDEVSDVVREYLGGRFGFDGLESTTDEMLALLRQHGANLGLWQEVSAYLRRCDLVKFAKVVPDQDEADLVLAKAQDIVQFSMPLEPRDNAQGARPSGAPRASSPPKRAAGPNDGGAA